ncbi:nuclease-related domain-containing protein [Rossellomorea marisflavi]|uniref:nuclease-related domain-containing protein n=1 Tax=Rossellomorea marisflavi TaxID=189381 RepID=UPI00064FBF63|nr:nuclease-related domain-containing protein [Rossellomorea marisflavi]KML02699.1 hypothetical protein VL06_16745 [Rossellomorea marisflavi]
MKVKELKPSLTIQKLQALSERVTESSGKLPLIQSDLRKFMSGYNGEKSLEYYLSFLPNDQYYILHDVRLFNGTHFFQLDLLIISPCFVAIVEVKNMSGHLTFDGKFNQVVQTKNGEQKAFPDPVLQLQKQISQYRSWLKNNGYPEIPIHGFIVMSNPYTVLTSENYEDDNLIIRPQTLVSNLQTLMNYYETHPLPHRIIKKISKQTLKHHIPDQTSILLRYGLEKNDIHPGVKCPQCSFLPMDRIYKFWRCIKCDFKAKDAHFTAVRDYFLLLSNTITNQQCREFLLIDCLALANRLLQSTPHLTKSGHYKSTFYTISEQINL